MKKYGMLRYDDENGFNIGDNIQSIAAKQYLPQVDELVLRDDLSSIKNQHLNVIMNGWYSHKPTTWLPNEKLNPLFVSFHINSEIKDIFLNHKVVCYLKKYAPIGCRDRNTVKYLIDVGVDAYYTGCLTLTLDSYKSPLLEKNNDIYIVDPFFNLPDKRKIFKDAKSFIRSTMNGDIFKLNKRSIYLEKILDNDLIENAKYETHVFFNNKGWDEEKKTKHAESLLKKYSRAKLVITSRIHCALPCLAMGTPVIFLNAFESEIDMCRFDGLLDFFNVININDEFDISSNFKCKIPIDKNCNIFNKADYLTQAEELKNKCIDFINS